MRIIIVENFLKKSDSPKSTYLIALYLFLVVFFEVDEKFDYSLIHRSIFYFSCLILCQISAPEFPTGFNQACKLDRENIVLKATAKVPFVTLYEHFLA